MTSTFLAIVTGCMVTGTIVSVTTLTMTLYIYLRFLNRD